MMYKYGARQVLKTIILIIIAIYCRVPVRRGLCKTAMAPGSDETRFRDPLVRTQVDIRKTLSKRVQTNKLLK